MLLLIYIRGGYILKQGIIMAKKPAEAGAKKGRGGYISKAPIRRLMKDEGAVLVAEEAITLIISHLTDLAKETTKAAVKLVKDEKRKRLTAADIMASEK